MALPLIPPESQFIDADGAPYAGGTIDTFVPGTSTPKDTWSDMGGTALNTNPVVLDAAGRALLYGDGDYRFVVKDALGNLVYDQETTSFVSSAMQPVVAAATLADARNLLGIDDAISTEASARSAADSAEAIARANADTAETNARTAADTTLQTNIDAEVTRATAAEAALTGGMPGKIQYGYTITDNDGHKRVDFGSAYTGNPVVVVTQVGSTYDVTSAVATSDTTGFNVWWAFPGSGAPTPAGTRSFFWVAIGPA